MGIICVSWQMKYAAIQCIIVSVSVDDNTRLLLLLLFHTFSVVLVANSKKLLYTVANPARGLLNREKKKPEKFWQRTPPLPLPSRCSFGDKIKKTRDAYTYMSRC